jgi:hypothetical protein
MAIGTVYNQRRTTIQKTDGNFFIYGANSFSNGLNDDYWNTSNNILEFIEGTFGVANSLHASVDAGSFSLWVVPMVAVRRISGDVGRQTLRELHISV